MSCEDHPLALRCASTWAKFGARLPSTFCSVGLVAMYVNLFPSAEAWISPPSVVNDSMPAPLFSGEDTISQPRPSASSIGPVVNSPSREVEPRDVVNVTR